MLPREVTAVGTMVSLLRKVHLRPGFLVFPILLGILAAGFEGIGVGLLIPMVNGFLSKDFSFVKTTPGLSTLISLLPDTWTRTDRALFSVLLSIFALSIFFKNVCRYLSVIGMSFYATRAHHHVRKTLFGRYLSFGKLFFDRTNIGTHTTALSEFTYEALRPIFRIDKYMNAFFSLIVYLIVMSRISWKLTAFALPLFVLLHFSVKGMVLSVHRFSHALAKSGTELGKKTVEILSLLPLVHASLMEEEEKRRYTMISDQKARLDFRMSAVQEVLSPLQELITLVAVIVLFTGMLYFLVREQTTTAPSFIVYFYIVLNASSKFGTLTNVRSLIAGSVGPLAVIQGLFEDEGKEYVHGGEKEFQGLQRNIEFRNLRFSYPPDRTVLTDIRFSISRGEVIAIVGPTGGGKTTIVSLLMRYYDCPPSSIIIDDEDIRAYSIPSLRKHIALVSQETQLLHTSLLENIRYGVPGATIEEVERVVQQARLKDFVAQLPEGLSTLVGDRGVKLSGGEKQRVSIARALLKGSDILILDEATSALDSTTEHLIQEAIDEAIQGKTAIVIAHRLSTIQHADRIVVIDQGRVREQGTRDELLAASGLFRELWEQQKF